MSVDWLSKLGRKGLQALVEGVVDKSVNQAIDVKVDPRLRAIEARLSAIEQRLDFAERLAKVEADLAAIKSRA